jgi:hypothetical protein
MAHVVEAHGSVRAQRALLNEWDPIGVRTAPEAQDEYSGYAGGLARMLYEGAGVEALEAELRAALDHMGLTPIGTQEREVAERILDWFDASGGPAAVAA